MKNVKEYKLEFATTKVTMDDGTEAYALVIGGFPFLETAKSYISLLVKKGLATRTAPVSVK